MLEKVEYYKRLLEEKSVKQAVGITQVFLDGNCKCEETNLADLIADSFIREVSILWCMAGDFNITLKSGDKKWLENINTPTHYLL